MAEHDPTKLGYKQRMFVEAYLGEAKGNGSEAARIAGYKFPAVEAHRLLINPYIAALVQARVDEAAMGADEVLRLLAQQARGTMAHFIDGGALTLTSEAAKAHYHLIKRVKIKEFTSESGSGTETEYELYDAQGALNLIGRHHKLFTDRHEVTDTTGLDLLRKALEEPLDDGEDGEEPDGDSEGA